METTKEFVIAKQAAIAVELIKLEAARKSLIKRQTECTLKFGSDQQAELDIIDAQIKALEERQFT